MKPGPTPRPTRNPKPTPRPKPAPAWTTTAKVKAAAEALGLTCSGDSFGVTCDGSTAATQFSVTSTSLSGPVEDVDITGSGNPAEVANFLLLYCKRLLGSSEGNDIMSWVAANDTAEAVTVIGPIAVTYHGPLDNADLTLAPR